MTITQPAPFTNNAGCEGSTVKPVLSWRKPTSGRLVRQWAIKVLFDHLLPPRESIAPAHEEIMAIRVGDTNDDRRLAAQEKGWTHGEASREV